MKRLKVDIAIIGAGTAGMTAYREAVKKTDSVILIEANQYGTTCARVGCMPSKLLIAAAEVSHQIDTAEVFGLSVSSKQVLGDKVLQRVRDERDRFVGFVVDSVESWPEHHRIMGEAQFVSDKLLYVSGHTEIEFDRVVIATGSEPAIPGPWNELGDRLLINDDVFSWTTLPDSIAVAGTGVIGMELSQALARLGVRTHMIGIGNQFGPLSDPAINAEAHRILASNFKVSADSAITAVRRTEAGVEIHYLEEGAEKTEQFDYLLAATGRRPKLKKLKLENAGLNLDKSGIPAFELTTGQVEDSHIFIAGDVSNAHPLLHEAADDGRIAGHNAAHFPDVVVRPRRAPLSIVFTDPQIALAGARYAELKTSGIDFAIGEASFAEQGRARVIGKNKGLIHVYGEKYTGRFLGAEMIGPAAEHIGHLLAWSVQQQLTVQQMLDSPFYHPVIEEGLRTALRHLNRALRMGPIPVERCLDCGPGA
jgi:dihydrolipoamide dehydrogenase